MGLDSSITVYITSLLLTSSSAPFAELTAEVREAVKKAEFFLVLGNIKPRRQPRSRPQKLLEIEMDGDLHKMTYSLDRLKQKGEIKPHTSRQLLTF